MCATPPTICKGIFSWPSCGCTCVLGVMDEYFLSFFFCFVNSFSALDLLRTQLVCPTLLQFFMNHSETLQASFSWSVDVHVT